MTATPVVRARAELTGSQATPASSAAPASRAPADSRWGRRLLRQAAMRIHKASTNHDNMSKVLIKLVCDVLHANIDRKPTRATSFNAWKRHVRTRRDGAVNVLLQDLTEGTDATNDCFMRAIMGDKYTKDVRERVVDFAQECREFKITDDKVFDGRFVGHEYDGALESTYEYGFPPGQPHDAQADDGPLKYRGTPKYELPYYAPLDPRDARGSEPGQPTKAVVVHKLQQWRESSSWSGVLASSVASRALTDYGVLMFIPAEKAARVRTGTSREVEDLVAWRWEYMPGKVDLSMDMYGPDSVTDGDEMEDRSLMLTRYGARTGDFRTNVRHTNPAATRTPSGESFACATLYLWSTGGTATPLVWPSPRGRQSLPPELWKPSKPWLVPRANAPVAVLVVRARLDWSGTARVGGWYDDGMATLLVSFLRRRSLLHGRCLGPWRHHG